MMATSLAHSLRSLSRQPTQDPDIQATLSDFLTYTEHFPAHITRALTLIGDQRARAEEKIRRVHEDTTIYSTLPLRHEEKVREKVGEKVGEQVGEKVGEQVGDKLGDKVGDKMGDQLGDKLGDKMGDQLEDKLEDKLGDKLDPVQLRRSISYALEEAERAARMAAEEATRMDEMCQRESRRLDVVMEKLKSQPLPPSRDPTPEQQPLTSPNPKRERRISVRGDEQKLDKQKLEKSSRKLTDKAAAKLRGRKIMVPGEVLPPPDPNAPVESISSGWTSPRASPPVEEPPIHDMKKATPRPRSRTPKLPKTERDRKTPKPRAPRQPGQPGTNAHSAVAGISTSNALLALKQPPDDARPGSSWLPWMRLTEWEMAKLRKRMKKNAIWVPSQTMVRRELKNLGRGVAGRDAARGEAENGGPAFIDESNEPDPTKVLISGEETAQINALLGNDQLYMDEGGDDADQELINRGMRLNEAKKLKRLRLQEEQALQAQIAREQGLEAPTTNSKTDSKTDVKKRKRELTPAGGSTLPDSLIDTPDPLSKPGPAPKKLKISGPAVSSKVPLAPAGSSPKTSTSSRKQTRAATPPLRKPTITIKAGKAVSEEPPNRRAGLRRTSNASLPNGTLLSPTRATASTSKSGGGRRSRRPAPGILTTADDESAKVGVSKRKAAPRKKAANRTSTSSNTAIDAALPLEIFTDEPIDPNEPRYCICGDVSWGTMIACDNDDCEKEWFHLTCVALDGMPPRRTKWYCPDCRKKLKLGQNTNGLVGRVGPVGGR